MPNCTSCGRRIPEGQGRSCSMCYGDLDYGRDGYYRKALEEAEAAQQYREAEERAREAQEREP